MNAYRMFGDGRKLVLRDDGANIPFDMANTDCREFIADWKAGAEVRDAAGVAVPYSVEAVEALGLTAPADPC